LGPGNWELTRWGPHTLNVVLWCALGPRVLTCSSLLRGRGYASGLNTQGVPYLGLLAGKGVFTEVVITSIISGVKQTSKRRGPACPEEAAYLDLLRTTDMLSRGLVQLLKPEDLSATQYNVLRILRGAPEGLACAEIARRMITRDPDVTRLLDRLERRGLISRWRETKDRRTVMARITPEGLTLLARLDEPVQAAHRKQLGHLGRKRLQTLAKLLGLLRDHVA
jgi:DNA-binding MarR family transcriptional regulator